MLRIIVAVMVFGAWMGGQSPAIAQENLPWTRVCDQDNSSQCRLVHQINVQREVDGELKTVGRLIRLTVLYVENRETKKRQPYLSAQFPLGVDLRPGAVIKIDQGKDIPIPYLQCKQSGCDASLLLDSNLLSALKAGNTLFVGFRPWGTEKVQVLQVSLRGFTAAVNTLN